ncbi:hypothetical protein M422DRAFT_211869 [Sphaerobolus stellatus SS14]|uniref:Translocation protein SEC62 n=1 Tax=Sphaerobolus stellatus (strain SS14) TaxID=990650 RepID=A0A0C9T5D5_SPHS4|nr:hypothetical protein M422DRAFT_785960 [Sphaerobolus stellatus SS14]KIJ36948.1 hypothetical protein M422DRAFT_211869 [Sphaerobolus stellatus SS14]
MSEQQKNAPPQVRNVADFLRSGKGGLKTRVGLWNGKRVDYFKGKSAIKALLSPAYAKAKNVPPVKSEEEATALLTSMVPFAFFLLVQRGQPSSTSSKSPKVLQVSQMQSFAADGYFAWFYEGSQLMTYVGGAGMVLVILAGVMFPLWPPIMRLGAWYVSLAMMGFLALFFAIAAVRLVVWIVSIFAAPPGLWIFPKLFADVGFFESFVPLWEWDIPKKKSKKSKKNKEGAVEGGDATATGKAKVNGEPTATATVTATATATGVSSPSTSASPQPTRQRSAMIEEVEDDGS